MKTRKTSQNRVASNCKQAGLSKKLSLKGTHGSNGLSSFPRAYLRTGRGKEKGWHRIVCSTKHTLFYTFELKIESKIQ